MFTFKTSRHFFQILFFGGIMMCNVVTAQEQPPEFKGVGLNFGPSNNSFGLLPANPSNFEVNMESVNLYTGQHVETIPLESISGRGGLGISLALEYNGNVYKQVREENRKSQASPFGLGFSLAMPSIIVQHNGTAYIFDDEYKLIVNNTGYDLKPIVSNDTSYITNDGQPWRIYRHIDTVENRETVTGWTIHLEDGTIYKLGDFADSLTGWNATRNILRYGNFVGIGVALGDTAYPSQWDLKRIEDVEGLNWIDISYLQDSAYLLVKNASGDALVDSDFPYTRASYIDEIVISDGKKIKFEYGVRHDIQPFHDINSYEFYFSKKINEIKTLSKDDIALSRVIFNHAYYQPKPYYSGYNSKVFDSSIQKLLLRSIHRYSSDESEKIPGIEFDYYTDDKDPRYLRVSHISYPTGAIKEIRYDVLDNSLNFSLLDHQIIDDVSFLGGDTVQHRENLFITKFGNPDSVILGVWDGYWHVDTVVTTSGSYDLPGLSSDRMAVIPSGDTLFVYNWEGGYWKVDTILNAVSRTDNVYLYVGSNDCFIATTGGYNPNCDKGRNLKAAYYFRRINGNWQKETIVTYATPYDWHTVQMGTNTFAISLMNNGCESPREWWSDLLFGIWNSEGDSLAFKFSGYDKYELGNRYVTGADFVAKYWELVSILPLIIILSSIDFWVWNGVNWDSVSYDYDYPKTIRGIYPLSNGLCYTVDNLDTDLTLGRMSRTSGGFRNDYTVFGDSLYEKVRLNRFWGSETGIIAQYEATGNTAFFKWTGLDYDPLPNIERDSLYGKSAIMFRDFWAYGVTSSDNPNPENHKLQANIYEGNQNWPDPPRLSIGFAEKGIVASDWYVLWRHADTSFFTFLKPYYFNNFFRVRHLDTIAYSGVLDFSNFSASKSSFVAHYQHDPSNSPINDAFAYKIFDTLFNNKPPILVVDSVIFHNYNGDSNPIIQTYEYFGALLDEQANTPRFAEAKVSSPYYSDDLSPLGYTVNLFYNDIDSTGFYDPAVYSGGRVYPDLKDSATFGMHNGGYLLDGIPYLSYTYTNGAAGRFDDSSRSFFSLVPNDTVADVIKVLLDSTFLYRDSILTKTFYKYDPRNWRIVEKKTPHKVANSFIIDSVFYAYTDTTGMEEDNAVVQVSKTKRILDSIGTEVFLSIDSTDYALKGSWVPVKSYAFPDFDSLGNYLIVSDTLNDGRSFDSLGNMLARKNHAGVVSGTHLSPDGIFPIATFSNANPEEVIIFDAEYGLANSKWENLDSSLVSISNSNPFTGDYSLKFDKPGVGHFYDALKLHIVGDSLKSDKYYFSMWAKSLDAITPIITAYDNTGACLQLSAAYFATGKWMQVNRLIDLTGCGVVDSLTIVLRPNFNSGDSSFVDDIRFHPIDASISTATFDSTSGLKVSQSDRDNFPLRFEYDKLQRLVNTYRYTDTLLERTEYEFAKKPSLYYPFGKYAASDPFHSNFKGLKTSSIVLSKSQTVNFHLEIKECYGSHSYGVIKREGTIIKSLTDEEGSCIVIEFDSSFFALAGEEIRIEVYSDTNVTIDSFPAYTSAYIGYAVPVDAPYDPDKPNYVKTTRFVEGTDPLESVMFFDGMGKNLQSRSDAPDSGKTVVSGWLTDVFGQQIKTYKSYIEQHSTGYDTTYRYDSIWQYCDWGEFYTFDEHDTSKAIIDSTEFTMDGPARIFYTFHMLQEIGVGEGCYLFLNNTLIDSLVDCRFCGGLKIDDTCLYVEKWKDGVINVDSGDVIKYLLNNSYKGFPPICTTSYDGTWCGVYWDIGCINGIDTSMFIDTIVANSVVHYDNDSLVDANANNYYSTLGPGPDCKGYPYLENVFDSDMRRRRIEAALPGEIYSVNDTNTAAFLYGTDTSNKVYIDTTYDQDDVMTVKSIDHWGLFSKTASYYEAGLGTESVIQITNNDYRGRATYSEIDTGGAQPIKLRESFYNDLNQQDSTWKMDYGTIRMIYDISGNLRFMQNDKRKDEDRFVYFKYDETGRKIEEGREDSAATYFKQSWADSADFPSTSHVPVVRYKWFYDSYDTILAPGKLVRVENGDQSYYSEFHYFPEGDSDLTIVKLPITGDNLKGIKHEYNWDGSLKYLTVFPHWDSATANNERKSEYLYNEAGKIRAIKSLDSLPGSTDSLFYVQYKYTAEGAVETAAYGISYDSIFVDTIQKIDYTYNSIGALIGVNHPDSVVDGLDFGVTAGDDNDHFGMNLTYLEPDGQYANGRVSKMSSARSSTDSVRNFSYDYTYNDLGWLEIADETSDTSVYTRKYGYNALGNRLYVKIGSDSVHYVYDTVPGSSKLLRTSDMPTADSFYYDVLGNLIADTAHERYWFTYDYRNLIWAATLKKEIGQLNPHSKLGFLYDENENRILKDYTYYVLVECGGPPPLGPMGFGPGGGLCPETRHTYTTYLYDNGVPLAVFDNSDNVIDMFINGPNGKIATFWQNDIDKLHYYFSDQVGSTRMTMIGEPSVDTANVSSWYTYNPFGSLMESYEVYSTPYRFTSKLYDDELSFDLYYFGARYYDPVLGKFTTIDKAGQFASGFTYGNNDPILGVDPDGNLFFLSTAFLIGALLSSGSYAITTDNFRLEKFLGHAFVGGFSSYVGNLAAQKSAILGGMYSSTLSSTGASLVEGRDGFLVNFGFGSLTQNGFSFNNHLSFSGAASWLTVAEDLTRVFPGGETLEEIQQRQIETNKVQPGELDLRGADLDAIYWGTDREVWQDYKGRMVHQDGTPATAQEIIDIKENLKEFRLPGNYHVYSDINNIGDASKYIFHKDALGSWSKFLRRSNWGTGLQHILFESVPHDYFPPILNDIPYFLYRNPYSVREY